MRYTLLGNSGLRVSELSLGTMTFGEDWSWGAGPAACEDLLDRYVAAGGNFVDTANVYTNGTSERIVGDLLEGRRDEFVVATKYTLDTREGDPNAGGNHRKNVMQAIEGSLERLGTDYVDLLWVHAWDGLTPVEEVLRGLDDLASRGTVHHVGFSDAPAWVVADAHRVARERGWAAPAAIQIEYTLTERTPERELLPMARALGLGVVVWGPPDGGLLTGKYLDGRGDEARPARRHPGEPRRPAGRRPPRPARRGQRRRAGVPPRLPRRARHRAARLRGDEGPDRPVRGVAGRPPV
jgi:aryl-alcohol dehydrogenase-like predicted oxidoreductase